MQTVDKNEIEIYKEDFFNRMHDGKIFIHPTDTIYGLGCDATNHEAVSKLREVKQRPNNPFSIIVPSKEWIEINCKVDGKVREAMKSLPGPVTLILELTNKNAVANSVNNNLNTVGVRIPDHWISKIVEKFGKPIVSTSVNIQKQDYVVHPDHIHPTIRTKVDFAINEGEKIGRPSKIINLVEDKVIER